MKADPVCRMRRYLFVLPAVTFFSLGLAWAAERPVALEATCPSCDDFSFCTVDSCDTTTGTCRHDPRNCDDGNPCTNDLCQGLDPAFGFCRHDNLTSGSPCSDGNACTQGDSCQGTPAGTLHCVGTSQPAGVACDDGNSCTAGEVCDATGQCTGTPASIGSPCDDQSPCTSNDTCIASPSGPPACSGAAKNCGDGSLCTQDLCDPATGQCGNPPVNCNDGNACTGDACDAATGQCVRTNLSGACSDNNVCTLSDFCSAGNCTPGAPNPCADAIGCTRDTCSPSIGCSHTRDESLCPPDDGCHDWSCQALNPINGGCVNRIGTGILHECDGNPCTIDACDIFSHCIFQAFVCSDGNPCTDDTCDPATLACTGHVNNTGPCNDGNVCTSGDRCSDGVCQGTPLNCDDSNACTADSCVAGTNCSHSFIDCDDRNVCTTDECDYNLGCVLRPGISCDDGNACTADVCGPTNCSHSDITPSCDDQDVCTIDSCDPASGCAHQSVNTRTTCGIGACRRTVDTCLDGVPRACAPGTPATEVCNGIDDDCDGLTDENRVQGDCAISPSTINLSSQGGQVSVTCKLLDVCDPANPVPISGSIVTQTYISRVDSADNPGDDVTLPDPSTLPCPDPVLGFLYERGISENLEARDVSNANVTFKFNLPSDGNCSTLDGNRQDIAARLSAVPDNTSATICISGKAAGADFQACQLILVRNKGLR